MVLTVELGSRNRYTITGSGSDDIEPVVYAEFDECRLALDVADAVAARHGLHVMYDPWGIA